jgi:hypothetical protein
MWWQLGKKCLFCSHFCFWKVELLLTCVLVLFITYGGLIEKTIVEHIVCLRANGSLHVLAGHILCYYFDED